MYTYFWDTLYIVNINKYFTITTHFNINSIDIARKSY